MNEIESYFKANLPESPYIYEQLGYVHFANKDFLQAEKAIQKAYNLLPFKVYKADLLRAYVGLKDKKKQSN